MNPPITIIHQDQSQSIIHANPLSKEEQLSLAKAWWNLRTAKEQAWIRNYLINEKKAWPIPDSEFILRAFQTDWSAFFEFNSLHSLEK